MDLDSDTLDLATAAGIDNVGLDLKDLVESIYNDKNRIFDGKLYYVSEVNSWFRTMQKWSVMDILDTFFHHPNTLKMLQLCNTKSTE